MTAWERFVETFFNTKVMLKYLPDILSGMVVTIELAVLIVVTGIAAGLVLALIRSLGVRPLNWVIIGIVDLFRSPVPMRDMVLGLVTFATYTVVFLGAALAMFVRRDVAS